MRRVIHRKLTTAQIERLHKEAVIRVNLTSYKQLAAETGLAHGSIKQLMAQLMRELKKGSVRLHCGTDRSELAAVELGLQ